MPNDPTQLQQLGTVLGGFSAGLQGRGPQFQAQQMQKQAFEQQQSFEQSEARQQAAFQDAAAGLTLLDEGNYDGLMELGMTRLQGLRGLGAEDPSDTQRLMQLALAARNGSVDAEELLRGELENTVSVGRALGVLETPEPPTPLTEVAKLNRDLELGNITPEQFETEVERASRDDLNIVQRYRADGGADTLLGDGFGNYFTLSGEPAEVSDTDRIIEGSSLTGSPEDLGLSDSEFKELRDAEVSTKTFIATVGDALQILEDTPDINTFVSRGAAVVNNLQQEARAIGRALDLDFDESILSPSTHEDTFDELGIENQRLRSIINSLAFQAAAASGQSGRSVSDRDVTRFIREIGADAADPRAFARVLRDVADRTARNFQINYQTRLEEDFTGDLGLENLPTFEGGSSLTPDITELSDEELLNF